MATKAQSVIRSLTRWIVSDGQTADSDSLADDRIDWVRCVPFIALHLACLAVIWVGFSWVALGAAVGLYLVRMFAITGFYHRYFSHRSFRTSRAVQFLMAVIGSSAGQRGPIWWAGHHRHHHVHSDDHPDHHSPGLKGFLIAHMGWFMTPAGFATKFRFVRDWSRYPELRLIDRFDWLVPLLLAVGLFGLGEALAAWAPGLGTSGWQMFVWGFLISTIVLYHATYTINSLAHCYGSRRFATGDDSRNSMLLALLTLGEGWHNNHHHYPASVRQGFYWWEIDITYYALRALSWTGIIWDLRAVPTHALQRNRLDAAGHD